jgi:hypothetical protein
MGLQTLQNLLSHPDLLKRYEINIIYVNYGENFTVTPTTISHYLKKPPKDGINVDFRFSIVYAANLCDVAEITLAEWSRTGQ